MFWWEDILVPGVGYVFELPVWIEKLRVAEIELRNRGFFKFSASSCKVCLDSLSSRVISKIAN